jgi:signal transduction histidine kinase
MPAYVNPAGLKLVGLDTMEQARRTPIRDLFFPDDQPRIINDFLPSLNEQGHSEIEVRFRNFRTGEARWMDYKVLRLADGGGEARRLCDGEPRYHRAQASRGQSAQARVRSLRADHRKDEFLATLAHELRNPLAPLRNTLEVLKRSGGSAENVPHAIETMERQLKQLVRLVDDLLDLNRITHDRIELRKERVELVALIREVIESMRSLADTAGTISGRRPRGTALRSGRRSSAVPGLWQPAEQQLQVHRARRPHQRDGRAQ